ncbi:MAG: LUD domain-containing protein [Flavobacteriales bacterium]|nr:LUD domain-containing protein [Flavobacteriales bacterium]
MKNFLKKILGIKDQESNPDEEKGISLDDNTRKIKRPLDVKFAETFTKSGGRFIYCLDEQDVLLSIKSIIDENGWKEILSFDNTFNLLLDRAGIPHTDKTSGDSAFFTNCEALIAKDGSILISSNQTKGRKLSDLPYDFMIIGQVSDLLEDRSEGLSNINQKWHGNIPSSITTIKGPNTVTGTDNILDYGSINTSKNIYLLLVE